MNELKVFEFDKNNIRTETDEEGNVWFIAKDICEFLEYKSTSDTVSRLDTDERRVTVFTDTLGRQQEMLSVSESGLYTLIMRSNKTEAKPFRKWITSEVLPSLRKNGIYSTKEIDPLDLMQFQLDQMRAAREREKAIVKAITETSRKLDQVAIEAKQDNDTLTHDQITELDKEMDAVVAKTKNKKDFGLMKRKIKQAFFEIGGTRTYKEIPRKGFEEALKIIRSFR